MDLITEVEHVFLLTSSETLQTVNYTILFNKNREEMQLSFEKYFL